MKKIVSSLIAVGILFVTCSGFIGSCDETPESCWLRCIKAKQNGKEPESTNCDLACGIGEPPQEETLSTSDNGV